MSPARRLAQIRAEVQAIADQADKAGQPLTLAPDPSGLRALLSEAAELGDPTAAGIIARDDDAPLDDFDQNMMVADVAALVLATDLTSVAEIVGRLTPAEQGAALSALLVLWHERLAQPDAAGDREFLTRALDLHRRRSVMLRSEQ